MGYVWCLPCPFKSKNICTGTQRFFSSLNSYPAFANDLVATVKNQCGLEIYFAGLQKTKKQITHKL